LLSAYILRIPIRQDGPVKHESGGTPVFLSAFPVSYSTSIKTAFPPLETRLLHRF